MQRSKHEKILYIFEVLIYLMEQLEGSLLRLEALGVKTLESLLARSVLLLGYDTTLLGLHQILLGESTGSMFGSSVVDLGLGAYSGHFSTDHRRVIVVAILTSGVHFYISTLDFIPSDSGKIETEGITRKRNP